MKVGKCIANMGFKQDFIVFSIDTVEITEGYQSRHKIIS
jgi:hypothetical protein